MTAAHGRWACLILVALALVGCAGPSVASAPPSASASAALPPTAVASAASAQPACREALGPLLDAITDLDSRLAVGLTRDAFSGYVSDISVIEGRMDTTALRAIHTGCYSAGTTLSGILRAYILANDTWRDCTDDCDATVQAFWGQASAELQQANDLLDALP